MTQGNQIPHKYIPMKVEIDEDDVIQATVRLDRIKAVADSLMTIDHDSDIEGLYKYTIHGLMEVIDSQVDEAKEYLKY